MQKKILIIVGTRPEAIKMAPVYQALKAESRFTTLVLNSGQHDEIIQQVFDVFDWQPDYSLTIRRRTQDITELYALLFTKMNTAFRQLQPDLIIVHGDTATTTAASMAAYLNRIRIAHVEAGLRSFNRNEPWPEEVNRRVTDAMCDVYLAPTHSARENLLREGVNEKEIYVTGNTVVDALHFMADKIETNAALNAELNEKFRFLDPARGFILVTGHRRENYGEGSRQVFAALKRIVMETDCQVVFPAHPNIQREINRFLSDTRDVHILPPLNYPEFIYLMQRCAFIISDSGGIQEEAPTFNKKVLITRNVTERPEGVESGFLELVGCNEEKIVARAKAVLAGATSPADARNPYGDGMAAQRIRHALVEQLLPAGQPAKGEEAAEPEEALVAAH